MGRQRDEGGARSKFVESARHFVLRGTVLLLCIRILGAQTVTPTPGSIQDLSSSFPLTETFSVEPQIQNGMQGNSTNSNPFAYEHAAHIRLWLHYDGIRDATLTSAVSYIYYFTVPGTSYTKLYDFWHVEASPVRRFSLRTASLRIAELPCK